MQKDISEAFQRLFQTGDAPQKLPRDLSWDSTVLDLTLERGFCRCTRISEETMFSHSRLLDQLIKTDDEFTERVSERGAKQSKRDPVTSLRARNTRLRGGRVQSCFDK